MHTARLCKTFTFAAAHQLPNHNGKCRQPHGHTYRAEIVAAGRVRDADGTPSEGMVVDFDDIKAAWAKIEPMLDHRDLNVSIGAHGTAGDIPIAVPGAGHMPACWPTTSENIAVWILRAMNAQVPEVCGVRLWESPTSWAEAYVGDDGGWEYRRAVR